MSFQPGQKPISIGAHRRRMPVESLSPPLLPPPVVQSGDALKDISLRLVRLEHMMTEQFKYLSMCHGHLGEQVSSGIDAILEEFQHLAHRR